MRLTTVILIASLVQVSAAGFAQKISLSRSNTPLKSVLRELRMQSGYDFIYTDNMLNKAKSVDINVKNQELNEVLESIFADQPLTYSVDNKTVTLKVKEPSFLDRLVSAFADIDVRGRVLDETGNPLVGATVRVKGSGKTTKTNDKGEFYLAGVDENAVLEIVFLGYKKREIKAGKDLGEIKMEVQAGELEEVKVTYNTGYQTVDKTRATGSFVKVDSALFNRSTGTDIISRIVNVTPGLLYDTRIEANSGPKNKLQVRGQYTLSTIKGVDQPLIVVDNFPYQGDLNSLNPSDIEDVTVLRDAAAASIWGAKAGNGVIVITTKKAKYNQASQISLSSRINITEKPDLFSLDLLSSPEVIELEKFLFSKGFYDGNINNPQQPGLTPAVEILLKQRSGLITEQSAGIQLENLGRHDVRDDYLKYVYRKGFTQSHYGSFSSGGNKTSTIFSVGYDKDLNQSIGSSNDRVSLRTGNTFQPTKRLQIQIGLNYSVQNSESNGIQFGGLTIGQRKAPIYVSLADQAGNYLTLDYQFRGSFTDTIGQGRLLNWKYSPLDEMQNLDKTIRSQNLMASLNLNYKIVKMLSASISYQYQLSSLVNRDHRNLNTYYTRDLINRFTNLSATTPATKYPVPMAGILGSANSNGNGYGARGQLNFNTNWENGKHILSAISGMDIREAITSSESNTIFGYNEERLGISKIDLVSAYPQFFGGTSAILPLVPIGLNKTTNRFVSIFGNASYTFLNRYTVSSSARNDASNLFGVKTNQKGRPFWSAGMAWNISNESFYHFDLVPVLKFRMTYGYAGNIDPSVAARAIVTYSSNVLPLTNLPYASLTTAPNPTLRWEKVGTFNVALDFATKSSRLSGSLEYYRKKSVDVITSETLEFTTGLGTIRTNSADMNGNGIDLILNSVNIDKPWLKWNTSLNLSSAFYKIAKLKQPPITNYGTTDGLAPIVREGFNPYELVSFKLVGLDAKNGDPLIYVNGKVVNTIAGNVFSQSDMTFHGSNLPAFFGNFLNEFSWKGISLSANINYKFGYYFRRSSLSYTSIVANVNGPREFLSRWKHSGDESATNIPSFVYPLNADRDNIYSYSDAAVEKGDHVRWNDIRVAYNLGSLKNKLGIKGLNLFCYVSNLNIVLWTANDKGIDPENTGTYIPMARSIAFGINAGF